jgi:acyl-CoA thioester hydrolase
VRPEWIDYNGHMNLAYFVVAFDYATDAFFEYIGVGPRYRAERDMSTYVLETHITYHREMKEGDPMYFETQLLGHDAKRIHFFHFMYHARSDELAATTELMYINVDTRAQRSTPMPEFVQENLRNLMSSHAHLVRPVDMGRVIGLSRGNRA